MKQLAVQTLGAVAAALLVSCGLGYAATGTEATAGLRDVSVIILALFSLIGSVLLGGIAFGGAWAIGRFGPKAVAGVQRGARLVGKAEDVTQSMVEKASVRPVARAARVFTSGATFVRAALGATTQR